MTWPVTSQSNRRFGIRGQVLLDRGLRNMALHILDEGGDVERLHVFELLDAVQATPVGKMSCCSARQALRVWSLLICVVKNSSTRFAVFGVAREELGRKQGGGRGDVVHG